MHKPSPIHVAIVEDLDDIRNGLSMLIDNTKGFICKHAYSSAEAALAQLPTTAPDVVLMDIHLSGISGVEAVQQLKQQLPTTQFIMCTVYEEEEHIFDSLKAGASGYLLKNTPPDKLLEAITDVFNGGSPMSATIARKVISSFAVKPVAEPSTNLSERELQIIQLLAKGHRYKDIGWEINISVDTVRAHIRKSYEKLQVHSRTEAINKVLGR